MSRVMLAVMGCVFVLAGCGKKGAVATAPAPTKATASNEAQEFYDAVTTVLRRHEEAYLQLAKGFEAPTSGSMDLATLTKNQEDFAKSVSKSRADLKAISVPNVKGAEELYAASDRFFQAEDSTIKVGSQIVNGLQNLATFDAAQLGENLQRMKKDRERIERDLKSAHASFAKSHRLNPN